MSDDDMDMMYDDDEELPDDEEEEEGGVEMENEYYEAKGHLEKEPNLAIEGFERVVELEEEKSEWGFKALKNLVKLYFHKGEPQKAVERFKKFIEYTKSAVSANASEKGLNSVLDVVSTGKELAITEEIYAAALQALKRFNNERVWFRTDLRLAKLLYDHNEFTKLAKVGVDVRQDADAIDIERAPSLLLELGRRRRSEEGQSTDRRLRARDPDVHSDQEQQTAEGAVHEVAGHQECHSSSSHYGCDSGVWWQDAHEREGMGEGTHRLFRGL